MIVRFIGAVICCLYLSDMIQVKVLGHNESEINENKIILKCSDDQKINNYVNNIILCKVKPAHRCVLYNYKIAQNDNIFHPQMAEQKYCMIFQSSIINMLPVDFLKIYTSIQYADFSNTGLQGIEDFTFSVETLIELNLSGNDLTRLSQKAFRGAKKLKALDLSNNMISFIEPNAFSDLRSLINLNLSHNKLSNQSFSHDDDVVSIDWTIENLQVLDLSHNKIIYYDAMPFQSFAGMKNLKSLYLQHNQIAIDYGVFSSNLNLSTLDFSYNNNPYFDFNFLLSVRNLQNIYLNGNGISFPIDLSDIRASFPFLSTIGISNNSFSCGVLASIIRKLDKFGIEIVVNNGEFVNNARNIRGVKCF